MKHLTTFMIVGTLSYTSWRNNSPSNARYTFFSTRDGHNHTGTTRFHYCAAGLTS